MISRLADAGAHRLTNAPGPAHEASFSQSQSQPGAHLLPVARRLAVRLRDDRGLRPAVRSRMPVRRNSPIGVLRIAFGLALALLFCWGWLAEPLEHQVGLMGATVRSRLRQAEHRDQDQGGRPGDDAQPAAGTGADPLARLGISGVLLLQELHHAGLLPRPWRGLRGRGKAALRAGAGVADARAVRRRHHAAALRYRRAAT